LCNADAIWRGPQKNSLLDDSKYEVNDEIKLLIVAYDTQEKDPLVSNAPC
jgi:hypothetical protein